MDFEGYREDIEAVKTALGTCGRMGMNREKILVDSIGHLLELYEVNPEKEYLLAAILQIRAYLELGFAYDKCETMFEKIFRLAGKERYEVYSGRLYTAEVIKPNKSQIRNMIRKWSPTKKNDMTIKEVVEDILQKVQAKEKGTYYYKNYTSYSLTGTDIYELIISEEECYFHDLNFNRYFTFKD